jgi:hypothetical protein
MGRLASGSNLTEPEPVRKPLLYPSELRGHLEASVRNATRSRKRRHANEP